jgi:integrase
MKAKYRLFVRSGLFYSFDRASGKRESLKTSNRQQAIRLLQAKNESFQQPSLNRELAKTYLAASDPVSVRRTWSDVLVSLTNTKTGENQDRWTRAAKDPAFESLKPLKLFETTADNFLFVLKQGGVATNVFLRRLHNFALDLDWIPKPILSRKNWPPIKFGEKRAITESEHKSVVGDERNTETRLYYETLWHLGGSQSDVASLKAEDVDWKNRTIVYQRKKSKTIAFLRFGTAFEKILKQLPQAGPLFPRLARMHEKHRAKEFKRRCNGLKIFGVTLHSYRYALAQRCSRAGIPERHAMLMLGHNSKAVHRAYSKLSEITLSLPVLDSQIS